MERDTVCGKTSETDLDLDYYRRRNTYCSSKIERARSLYGVSPCCQFGPKGTILDNSSSFLTIPDPSSQKLKWVKAPLTVLVVKKMYDDSVLSAFKKLVSWLCEVVYRKTGLLAGGGKI
ncbi:NAD+ kinase [Mytilus galloprovincialis]|uniref:NAD+ kinase n=1 Tax=Mytilus galloprovincialis TaxID=29158 RepID=A0A8B6E5Z8_MYTGA|nr:NAD+ kinase [Mytilus galloprovincialis]